MSPDPDRASELRSQILDLVREYHDAAFAPGEFRPGETQIHFAGRVFDEREIVNLVDSALEFWLTTGPWAKKFERRFARLHGLRHALLVNSGSSANLVALSCLTSTKLGDRRLRRGDEVITVASSFPTTVNPIIQNGLVPVFVDVTMPDLQHRRDACSTPRFRTGPGRSWSPTPSGTRSTSTPSRRLPRSTTCG